MLKVRTMPCLLVNNKKLFKTINFSKPNYVGDPVNAIKIYNDKEVDELIFLDISATNEKRKPDFEMISQIASECFMPLAYGGGIREISDMKKIFNLGVEKIVICTYAVENPSFIKEAASLFGSQSIVVAIDVKKNLWGKYEVVINSGRTRTGLLPEDFVKKMEKLGAGEIFLNSIDRDGTFLGYDTELIRQISKAVSVPLIACGGARNVKDFSSAVNAGASAVAAGSMVVYHNQKRDGVLINFPSVKERGVLKEKH